MVTKALKNPRSPCDSLPKPTACRSQCTIQRWMFEGRCASNSHTHTLMPKFVYHIIFCNYFISPWSLWTMIWWAGRRCEAEKRKSSGRDGTKDNKQYSIIQYNNIKLYIIQVDLISECHRCRLTHPRNGDPGRCPNV